MYWDKQIAWPSETTVPEPSPTAQISYLYGPELQKHYKAYKSFSSTTLDGTLVWAIPTLKDIGKSRSSKLVKRSRSLDHLALQLSSLLQTTHSKQCWSNSQPTHTAGKMFHRSLRDTRPHCRSRVWWSGLTGRHIPLSGLGGAGPVWRCHWAGVIIQSLASLVLILTLAVG